ncbi:hypothetical protein [Streptomyces sp. NPDC059015]|uniref:hypothetical protein n=1 Tax=unclassified Streptomyces TaxID=2593676 RepID=UPI0036B874B7
MNTSTPLGATRVRAQRVIFVLPTDDADTYSNGIDWIAVERAVHGEYDSRDLTQAELREAVLYLRRHDIGRRTISNQLCVYERLVKEWEAEAGMLGPDDLCTTPGCAKARAGRGLCACCLSHARGIEKQQKLGVAA